MNRPPQLLTLVSILILSSLLFSACSLAENVTPPPNYTPEAPISQPQSTAVTSVSFPLIQPDPSKGAAIFAEKCAPCHGETGQGDGSKASSLPNPATALGVADVARQAKPSDWYTTVTAGKMDRYMPPFSSLTESQRWDVIAYAYSLSLPSQELSQGAELYAQNCASCHGMDGKGDGPSAATLNPAPQDLTQLAYAAGKSSQDFYQAISQGVPPAMPAFNQLSDQDRWTLADYVRSLSFSPFENVSASAALSTPSPASAEAGSAGTPVAQATAQATQAITATQTISNPIGIVTGQITNGSGGPVPDNLTVSLHGFDNMQLVITNTATTQAGGKYEFQNIEMAPGRIFLTSTDYQNTTYSSDIATISAGTKTVNLDIPIFDTTTDQSTLSADRMHIFFDASQPGVVNVAELYIISNTGNKTVISTEPNGPVMKFTLPDGAANLQFQDGTLGDRYKEIPGGFADTQPVHPGQGSYQVLYFYDLPYSGKLELTQQMSFPVNAVVVLLPENGSNVQSSQLTDAGSRDVQGVSYHMFNGGRIEAGGLLKLTLKESTSASSVITRVLGNSSSSVIIGAGALGLVLIVLGLVLYRRSTKDEEAESEDVDEDTSIPQDREGLMDAIIALDDLHKEGRLPEEAYQQRRAVLKERLKTLGN